MLKASEADINDAFQLEGLDRTHTLLLMLESLLGYYSLKDSYNENKGSIHPSIWDEETGKLLNEATSSLLKLYRKIGEWEEEDV